MEGALSGGGGAGASDAGPVSCRLCQRPCLPPHPSQLTKTNDPFIWVCSKCQYMQKNSKVEEFPDEGEAPPDDGHQVVPGYDDMLYCSLCNKGFDKTLQYQNHMRYHRAIRKFPCTHCSKSFSQSNNLRTHLRIHTNERPFKCLECGKAFTQVTNLNNHIRLHTGERPYVCTVPGCDKAFAQVTNLNNHRRSHQKEMPYACDLCDKIFSHQNHLSIHRQVHEQKLPNTPPTCLACGETFPEERFLKRHVRESCKEGGIPGPQIKVPGFHQDDPKKRCFFGDCLRQFDSMTKLHDHLARDHNMMINPHPNKSKRHHTPKMNFDFLQTIAKQEPDSSLEPADLSSQPLMSHPVSHHKMFNMDNMEESRDYRMNSSKNLRDDPNSSDEDMLMMAHQSSSALLRRPNALHELRLVCSKCFSTFSSPESLDRHVRKKHG